MTSDARDSRTKEWREEGVIGTSGGGVLSVDG